MQNNNIPCLYKKYGTDIYFKFCLTSPKESYFVTLVNNTHKYEEK